jgi:putative ABC transport system permease protein
MDYMDAVRREATLAARTLLRSRGFTFVATLTLALGLGATTAIFSLLDRIVLQPLPFSEPEQLVSITHPVQGPGMPTGKEWGMSSAGYFYFRQQSRTLTNLGAYTTWSSNVIADGHAERTQVAAVTATLLNTLRIRPVLGRLITEDDDKPGLPSVAMLGYDTWMQRFGGDPTVIGKTIEIEGFRAQIIGVTDRNANIPAVSLFAERQGNQRFKAEMWIPLNLDPAQVMNSHPYMVVGRMRVGATVDDVRRELTPLVQRFPELFPRAYSKSFLEQYHFGLAVMQERDRVIGPAGRVLWLALGAAGFVLVIAWANVANLFLVRLEARRRATAIRTALGAERSHLAIHFLSESLLVTLVAGVAGFVLAALALRLVIATAPGSIPRLDEVSLDWRAVAFTLGISIVAGLVFGLLPSRGTGAFGIVLRESTRSSTASKARRGIRNVLVVSQIALALVLLASAGLLVRSVMRLRDVRPGFEPRGVLAIDLAIPRRAGDKYDDYAGVTAIHQQILARVAALPGVQAAGMGTSLPLVGFSGCSLAFARDHWPLRAGEEVPCVANIVASPGYFRALGATVRGREPDWSDVESQNGNIVVTQELAKRMWPNEDPIGKGLNSNGGPSKPYYTIVGVVEGLRANGLDKPPTEAVFYPVLPMKGSRLWDPARVATLIVRAGVSRPTQLAASIRSIVNEIDPTIAIGAVRSMEQVVAESMSRVSFIMLLLSIAAGMAVVLSAIGLYGVISYIVAQRRSEIGIRMALGARVSQVSGAVVRQSVQLAGIGVAVGLVASLAVTRLLTALLFEVSPTDPLTLGGVSLLLVATAAVASYAPARRAAKIAPIEALRSE